MGILGQRRLGRRPAAVNPFKAVATSNLEVVRREIAAADQSIAELEANLQRAALAGALAGAESPELALAVDLGSQLNRVRERRELLNHAMTAAEREAEDSRRRNAERRFNETKRALAQHASTWRNAVTDMAIAAEKMQKSFDKAMTAAKAIENVVPWEHPAHGAITGLVADGETRGLVETEFARLARQSLSPFWTRGSRIREFEKPNGSVPDLITLAEQNVAGIKNLFRATAPGADLSRDQRSSGTDAVALEGEDAAGSAKVGSSEEFSRPLATDHETAPAAAEPRGPLNPDPEYTIDLRRGAPAEPASEGEASPATHAAPQAGPVALAPADAAANAVEQRWQNSTPAYPAAQPGSAEDTLHHLLTGVSHA